MSSLQAHGILESRYPVSRRRRGSGRRRKRHHAARSAVRDGSLTRCTRKTVLAFRANEMAGLTMLAMNVKRCEAKRSEHNGARKLGLCLKDSIATWAMATLPMKRQLEAAPRSESFACSLTRDAARSSRRRAAMGPRKPTPNRKPQEVFGHLLIHRFRSLHSHQYRGREFSSSCSPNPRRPAIALPKPLSAARDARARRARLHPDRFRYARDRVTDRQSSGGLFSRTAASAPRRRLERLVTLPPLYVDLRLTPGQKTVP